MSSKSSVPSASHDASFIKWDPKFKIGIPVIDAQHEHLVNLCNDFYQSLLKDTNTENYRQLVKQALEDCLDYAATHFKDEEKLMLASNFSGYKKHKAVHDKFTTNCKINYANIDTLPVAEAVKFALFLYDWVNTHIAHEDRLYLPALVEFLRKQKEQNKQAQEPSNNK